MILIVIDSARRVVLATAVTLREFVIVIIELDVELVESTAGSTVGFDRSFSGSEKPFIVVCIDYGDRFVVVIIEPVEALVYVKFHPETKFVV